METKRKEHRLGDIDFTVVYSRRRTIGISVLPDATVIVRVPVRTSEAMIEKVVAAKAGWIKKHRDNYRVNMPVNNGLKFRNGETHLFRGNSLMLDVRKSSDPHVRFCSDRIEVATREPDDPDIIKKILYRGYKTEAGRVFPALMGEILSIHRDQMFRPSALKIRSMKRRWGSCSMKGVITLSTELIKLPDKYISYVITHELCHLRHHNHGRQFYDLLTELCPDWRSTKKEMQKFVT